MIRASIARPPRQNFDRFRKEGIQVLEQRALRSTDRAASRALGQIRTAMSGSGLGRLGNALTAGSDLKKGGRIDRIGAEGFRVSGWVAIRSRSERAIGAIQAYTEGAEIRPVKGRWLWFATDDIPNRAGRYRMTPERYRQGGFEEKIGPLVFIRSINGRPLLVVKNVGVNAAGRGRSARSLRKNGQPRKGQRAREFLVAFVGIPRTSRSQRVNARAILRAEAALVSADLMKGS